MSRRKLFNSLSSELTQAARNLDNIETGFRIAARGFGMRDNRRKAQLEISNNLKQVILKRIYSQLRDELNEQPVKP